MYALGISGNVVGASTEFQKAVDLSGGKDWRALDMLATAYNKMGRSADAVQTERLAIELARQQQIRNWKTTYRATSSASAHGRAVQ